MRSYKAARGSFDLFEMLTRIVIAIGILAAVAGGALAAESMARSVPPPLAAALGATPGGLIALTGFFGLAMAQMGRASVDSAEYAQQALAVSRQQLELSQEALLQGKTTAASYAELLQRQSNRQAQTGPVPDTDDGASYGSRPDGTDGLTQLSEPKPERLEAAPKELGHMPHVPINIALNTGPSEKTSSGVVRKGGKYHVGAEVFKTAAEAKRYADKINSDPDDKLPGE